MRESRKRVLAIISAGAVVCGLSVAVEAPSFASSCAITDVQINALPAGNGYSLGGLGAGYCSGGSGADERLNVQVLHNYDALPDPIIWEKVLNKPVKSARVNFQLAGDDCDSGTKAQYYTKAQFTSKTPWSLTANKVIQAC